MAALLLAHAVTAAEVDVKWDGVNAGAYNDPFDWLPRVVPNNGNGGDTYRIAIGFPGPYLDIDATVNALNLAATGYLSVSNHSFTSAFTRNDTSAFVYTKDQLGIQGLVVNGTGKADLGILANYDAATQTLRGGSYLVTGYSTGANLSFKGAKIVTNAAGIRVGIGGKLTDEFGNDALTFLRVNEGLLDLTNFQTAGDFTNNGMLNLISHDSAPRFFVVTGKLTNFDPKTKTLTGGSYVVFPGYSGGTTLLQFPGADIVTNAADIYVARTRDDTEAGAASIVDEHGNDALRNFANNAAGGRITFADFSGDVATTASRVTNAGYMNLEPRFDLPNGGVFEQLGGELEFAIHPYFAGIDTHGGSFHLNAGRVTGRGTLVGSTFSNAVIAPGNNNYEALLTFSGDLVLGTNSVLRFDIKGLYRGPGAPTRAGSPKVAGYDGIDCAGQITIDGKLQVSTTISPASGDTFVVVKSSVAVTGSFANVANGARLTTVDGRGSFVVNYGPNSAFDTKAVVLSNFQANPRPAVLLNISTRGMVEGGQRVLIGGFIVTGSEPKPVLVRAIGPSLVNFGVPNPLKNPMLTLHNNAGATIASNDDWQQSAQWTEVQGTGIPPSDAREAAIVQTLAPGSYTAVLESKDGSSGIALVEIYDLDASTQSQLANISTRGYAGTGDNALIGGMIIGGGTGSTDIVVRGLGPSLATAGITEPLNDPYLYIKNQAGNPIDSNDNWRDNRAAIEATGIPPSNDRESAIARTLQPGAYTAIVQPAIDYLVNPPTSTNSGVGLVEFYRLR